MGVRETCCSFFLFFLLTSNALAKESDIWSGKDLPVANLAPRQFVEPVPIRHKQIRKLNLNDDPDEQVSEADYARFQEISNIESNMADDPFDDNANVPLLQTHKDEAPEVYPGNLFLGTQEDFTEGFESFEIRVTTRLIRYKLREGSALIRECIETYFQTHLVPNYRDVKQQCVGLNFEIIFQLYDENMRRLRLILMELLRLKMAKMAVTFTNEKDFFFDLLENFMERDLDLPRSLKTAARTSHYFIEETRFKVLLKMADPEIAAFDELHKELKEIRTEIQKLIDGHTDEAERYLDTLQENIEHTQQEEHPEKEEHSQSSEESESETSDSKSASSGSSSSSSESSESSESESSASSESESTGGHHHDHEHPPEEGEGDGKKDKKGEEDDDEKDDDDDEGDEKPEGEEGAANEAAKKKSRKSRRRKLRTSQPPQGDQPKISKV